MCVWFLALALHQDDLPPHALLLPAHPHAAHSQIHREEVLAGSGRSSSLTGSRPQEGTEYWSKISSNSILIFWAIKFSIPSFCLPCRNCLLPFDSLPSQYAINILPRLLLWVSCQTNIINFPQQFVASEEVTHRQRFQGSETFEKSGSAKWKEWLKKITTKGCKSP